MSEARRTSRRTILAAATAAAAAFVARAIDRPVPASATNGDVVHVGDFDLTGSLPIGYTSSSDNAIRGTSTVNGGVGVLGGANNFGTGVKGTGGVGVEGSATLGIGVSGYSTGGAATEDGVRGAAANGRGVWGHSTGNYGVYGTSGWGPGVAGLGSAAGASGVTGVSSSNATGVVGISGSDPDASGGTAKTGVFGQAYQDGSSRGVLGSADAGHGVHGQAGSGSGVFGEAVFPDGYAFRGSGRLRFDKVSGVATIKAGTKSRTLTPGVAVASDSFVLLTPRSNIGNRSLWFTTDPANDRITIHLSSSRTADTKIAWLLLH